MPLPRRDPSVRHVIDGVELRSYATGRSDARRTFLLIHGIGMSHHTFSQLAVHLREHGRVIAVDLAGFGSNRMPRQRVGIADHARLLARVLEDRGVPSAIVVGHSMGSQVAVELAVRSPELVDGVVLIGPVVDPERPGAAAGAGARPRHARRAAARRSARLRRLRARRRPLVPEAAARDAALPDPAAPRRRHPARARRPRSRRPGRHPRLVRAPRRARRRRPPARDALLPPRRAADGGRAARPCARPFRRRPRGAVVR
ncbi:alpha/beta fold hydrolase [Rathayibacter oskolensis]|uniref:alpha/beta fold hydrolase n=1 Tax=Rathayibacter oskolensis TaxID=1891671 RepID=UPI003466CCF2